MKKTVDRMAYLRMAILIILIIFAYGLAAQNNSDTGEAAFKGSKFGKNGEIFEYKQMPDTFHRIVR